MDKDERRRKVEAGRAKLADYRQRRAKGDGGSTQKKTSKRKGSAVQKNDNGTAQERHLEANPTDEPDHGQDCRTTSEHSPMSSGVDHSDQELQQCSRLTDHADTQVQSSLLDTAAADQPEEMEDVGPMIVPHTGKEQLKQLQSAVEKRNEIISQLSANLQAALESRDQVQREALQLTDQIQALQQQLQQTKEYLRSKSQGCAELSQAQQHVGPLLQNLQDQGSHVDSLLQQLQELAQKTKDQQCLLSQKDSVISDLQQKLGIMESAFPNLQTSVSQRASSPPSLIDLPCSPSAKGLIALSPEKSTDTDRTDPLIERLRAELAEEKDASRQARDRVEHLQQLVDRMESDRSSMEAQLAEVQAELKRAESHAHEAQQYKAEKDELNREMARLHGLVDELQNRLREEEEAARLLRSKHEADISNYDLRLQTLQEEREMDLTQLAETHEAAIKRLQGEHDEEVQRIQRLLEHVQAHDAHLDFSPHCGASEDLSERVSQVKASKEQQNQDLASEGATRVVDFCLDASISDDQEPLMEMYLASAGPHNSSWAEESMEQHSLLETSAQFELTREVVHTEGEFGVLNHTDNAADLTEGALSSPDEGGYPPPEQGESFVSEGMDEGMDLGKELLIQQCQELTDQLEQSERQLEIFQEEVRRSAEEVEEARDRWSKVSEELEALQQELEMEREARVRCEEILSQKEHEQDNLKNKLSFLQNLQQEPEHRRNRANGAHQEGNTLRLTGDDLIKELKEEMGQLVVQLKLQEQLVRDVQDKKLAGDSVSSELQAVFGRQVSVVQAHRDQLLAQLESQREKNLANSLLLEQKNLEVDSMHKELQQLSAQVDERGEKLQALEKERTDLESKLVCLKQNLTNVEEAQSHAVLEKAGLERRIQALEEQVQSMESVLESELEDFQNQLEAKDVELEKAEEERMEKEKEKSALMKELDALSQTYEELEKRYREEVQALLQKEEGVCTQLKSCHEEEMKHLKEKHQKEIDDLVSQHALYLSEQKANMEEEQRRQISMVKQVNEREHQRVLAQLSAEHRETLESLREEIGGEQRDSMEEAHQAEMAQAQTQKNLELEALRLSLSNMHTAQLELSQANMQKEREAALSELQAALRDKWAQESAMLQTRQQFELERLRQQGQQLEERLQQQHQHHMDDLKTEWEKRLSEEKASAEQLLASKIQELNAQWTQESDKAQADLQARVDEAQRNLSESQAALAEAQDSLEGLQASQDQEVQRLNQELSQACADRDSATRAIEELVASHKVVLQEEQARSQQLEEREKQLLQEVEKLQMEQADLKVSSQQEVAQLWSQLEAMRSSRLELGELKEQLMARSSRVDDIERLKSEFTQQRRDLQEQNESELENLRTYFEQRLRSSEESHREEIALLQLRLIEGALEESVFKTGDSTFLSEGRADEERDERMAEITQQLEKNQEELLSMRVQLEEKYERELELLRSSMALAHREELLQVRTDITDRYFSEIQELKNKHALELEQLRARLSESHVKEITRLRLQAAQDVARQVEGELAERGGAQEQEHQARLAQLQAEAQRLLELEARIAQLTQEHVRELERVATQHQDELRQAEHKLKEGFAEELHDRLEEARSEERERLSQQAQEQQRVLREELQVQWQARLDEQRSILEAELDGERQRLRALHASLEAGDTPQLLALRQRLQAQHEGELRTARATMAAEVKELNTLLLEQSQARLTDVHDRFQEEKRELEENLAQERDSALGELQQKHQAELEAQKAELDKLTAQIEQVQQERQNLTDKHQSELESISTNHEAALQALEAELAARHRAEFEKLEAVLQEANEAQLEAKEVELERRHRRANEELEAKMLANMDTLENTYLQEIQTVREEGEAALAEFRAELEAQHKAELKRLGAEQLSITEELRKELAKAHLDKFNAMATELNQAHQAELSAALSQAQAEHCSVLEALQQQVLDMEQQHSAALLEVRDMSSAERQQLQQQVDMLRTQHQQQLQELNGASARELEALRRELEEETSRQRQHFLEEAELLKCQSEELLQQRISQLKEESERERKTAEEEKQEAVEELTREREEALVDQEGRLRQEQQELEKSYKDKMDQLSVQLQQLDTVVAQLRSEVSGLQGELAGKSSEMSTLEGLLQRREREGQEGDNLVTMLRDDLAEAKQQRQNLSEANERLQHVVLEMLKSAMATEELVSRRMGTRMPASMPAAPGTDSGLEHTTSRTHGPAGDAPGTGSEPAVDGECGPDASLWSLSDEGLELSQRLCESLFVGAELQQEELLLGAGARLRLSVDKLLELVDQVTKQVEQTERFSQTTTEETAQLLLLQHNQLLEQLDQESSQKGHLQLELHKAEGLLEGYVCEKASLEESLQQKESREQRLVQQLEEAREQLQQLSEENTLLLRQRDALSAGLGDAEKGCEQNPVGDPGLLEETQRLAQERLDVQRQAEKDRSGLGSRLRVLEATLEEQETREAELELQRRAHTEDLQQHIHALEKQLKHHRHFIDEQAVEREHERDEFQQEIKNLEAQLKLPTKGGATDNKGQRIEELLAQAESLQAIIRDKMEDYSVLQLAKEQAQRDVDERNEEIDKLTGRIRELEQALLASAEASRAVMQLEQELQRARKNHQDLIQDKEALQQQQYANKLQISALQSKLDETKHRLPDNTADHELRQELDIAIQELENKDQQVEDLLARVEDVQAELELRQEEVQQLSLQLELSTREHQAREQQLQDALTELQDMVSDLRRQQEEQEEQQDEALQLPAALLEEKNQEIDHLNQQLLHFQQELDLTRDNRAAEEKQAEIEELQAQVERLHGDQERVREAQEQEVEQLHEVIQRLQSELAQLAPDAHELSDPQAESSEPESAGSGSGTAAGASPESTDLSWHAGPRVKGRRAHARILAMGQEESLCHELASHSLQASRQRLRKLRQDLEEAAAEKEALQRLLLSQEEEYGQQVQTLGASLKEERRRLAEGQREALELRRQLEEREAQVERLEARARELEDGERERVASLAQMEVRVKEAERRRDEALRELEDVGGEAQQRRGQAQDVSSPIGGKEELKALVLELQKSEQESRTAAEKLRAKVAELEEQVQEGRSKVFTLETSKKELNVERQALRRREGRLQEEIENLREEVMSKSCLVEELSDQLEERVSQNEDSQKEVLTCAEETLAKADAALRERERQLNQLRAEHDALRAELAAVKEGLSSSTERAEKLQEEGQTKDRALADLEVYNSRLKAELRSLQEDLAVQEEELAFQQRELEQLRQRCSPPERPRPPPQLVSSTTSPIRHPHHHHQQQQQHQHQRLSFVSSVDASSLCSPELLRRPDASMDERGAVHLHAISHLSELSGLQPGASRLDLLHGGGRGGGGGGGGGGGSSCSSPSHSISMPAEPDAEAERRVASSSSLRSPTSLCASDNLSMLDSLDADKLDHLSLTPSMHSTSPGSAPEWVSDGYGSNVSSDLGARLKLELENTERLDAQFVEYLRYRGLTPADNADSAAGSMNHNDELLSPELQTLLKRVYQESCRVLSLSRRPAPSGQTASDSSPPPSWQQERRALQETVLSLRELLCRMADREPKSTGSDADWRQELLQAVRSVFDGERVWLHTELQALLSHSHTPHDHTPLISHMEKLLSKQEEQQKRSLEQLLGADRRSLQSEVQRLQAQLQTCSRQSQEQLQQLQATLTTTQEEGMQRLQHLRKQVEQLEVQLQQAQALCEDLRRQLQREQEVTSQLRADLEETSLQLHSATKSQEELQTELGVLRLRLVAEEEEHKSCKEAVEREQARVQEFQEQLQQESLRSTVEEQSSRLTQLSASLEQERATASNLRGELRIERSRCEALLAQECQRTQQATCRADEERARATGLAEALSRQGQEHARRLEEEARRQEAASAHDRAFIAELRVQLQQERSRQQQMEEEVAAATVAAHRRVEEEHTHTLEKQQQRNSEECVRLRGELHQLQAQREEVSALLQEERGRARTMQQELEALRAQVSALKEREVQREEQWERQRSRDRQEQADQERRHERNSQKLLELELLRQRDQQRLQELQHTLADLEEQEKQLTAEHLQRSSELGTHASSSQANAHAAATSSSQANTHAAAATTSSSLQANTHASHTTTFSSHTNTHTTHTNTHSLHASRRATEQPSQSANHSQNTSSSSSSSSGMLERLLRENSELSERLTQLSEERVSLKHTLSCLERELHTHKRNEQVRSSSEVAWQKERAGLQMAVRSAQSQLAKLTAEIENRPLPEPSHSKLQRLYEKYLRAESFRKSLAYQKRYLLLVLGGFQECEQVTLALIARMGAYPSRSDLQTAAQLRSRPINRFRTAVRVVIAIARLKFLTRKWQRAIKRTGTSSTQINGYRSTGTSAVSILRSDVLRPQHPSSAFNSPPTKEPPTQKGVATPLVPPIKSQLITQNRMHASPVLLQTERSLSASQDAERSLTEYIQHLETIQQRLGAVRPVSPLGAGESGRHGHGSLAHMMGQRQKWLSENRSWHYLSCLTPAYMLPPGSPSLLSYPRKSDR
ncbi:pericentrin isoform X2 [Alosa sapidissima]|uniref:pericentrin isoform X2 n=1 Tax=Alosa sapidissima TaxID=34773 RepID=UPI001C0809C7|nr:pericentrin isoform X2 [Alosa sapidissima]